MTTTTTRRPEPATPPPADRPASAGLRRAAPPTPVVRNGAPGPRPRHVRRVTRGAVPAGAARTAGLSLVAALALTVPAVGLLDALEAGGSALDVAASLLVVAGLDVVAGRGLYLAAGGRARPAAYAALLSRVGHGLLLAVAAAFLVARGAEGAPAFRDDWTTASLVLAAHLVVAGVALWRSRVAARMPALAVTAAGGVALLVSLAPGTTGLLAVLSPVLVGEALLAVTLLHCGLHPARWRVWAADRTVATPGMSARAGMVTQTASAGAGIVTQTASAAPGMVTPTASAGRH
jgi:hypothetical protein